MPPASQSRLTLEHSIIGRVGRAMAPVIAPLGFPWPLGVTLITGFVAKEVVVSSLAVLYQTGGAAGSGGRAALSAALREPAAGLEPLAAVAFMVFVLLYTPCVAAVLTIRRELGTRWMLFDIGYQLALAWVAAFAVYQGGRLLGLG
jgi:ferrous iron transport protein B